MNIQRDLFAIAAILAFSAMLRVGFCADAHSHFSPTKPLSFRELEPDQEVDLNVCGAHSRFSAAQICFDVEVFYSPHPEAKISLRVNASMLIPQVEKEWGHQIGEEVVRKLTPADVQILESYLNNCRAKGGRPTIIKLGQPTTTFTRIIYRTNQEDDRHADIDREEFYRVTEQAQQNFIKNFIGFKS